MRHIDTHIHIESGEYTLDWIDEFVAQAVNRGMDEIWLLEHCYRFREFVPMYKSVCAYSDYIDEWLCQKAGTLGISDYLKLIEKVRNKKYPVDIKWGLEVCYFKKFEDLVHVQTKDLGVDFLLGSTHFVDDFAFDHKYEHWDGVNVNDVFKRYYEISIDLANSGLFDGIAHPDSIKLFGHRPSGASFKIMLYIKIVPEYLFHRNNIITYILRTMRIRSRYNSHTIFLHSFNHINIHSYLTTGSAIASAVHLCIHIIFC